MKKQLLLSLSLLTSLVAHADILTVRYTLVGPDDVVQNVVEGKCDTYDLIRLHENNLTAKSIKEYPINLSADGNTYMIVEDYQEQLGQDDNIVCFARLVLCDEGEFYSLPDVIINKNQTLVLANKAESGNSYMVSISIFTSYSPFGVIEGDNAEEDISDTEDIEANDLDPDANFENLQQGIVALV